MKERRSQPSRVVRSLALVLLALVGLMAAPTAQTTTPPKGAAGRAGQAVPQADANGFKVGDKVQISTGFGWIEGTILSANGNNYRVRSEIGIELTKTYPSELRRIGPLTDRDKAAGQYLLHDRVQVNVNGAWVDGEIIAASGMEYQVQLSGNRTVWAGPPNLRPGAPAAKPIPAKGGVPPKPGLKSCAGKFEGRYATTGGFGTQTIVFRSGKAFMKAIIGDDDIEFECWMNADKIYLHTVGERADQDLPLDINDDGTLQSPLGELKKKGS